MTPPSPPRSPRCCAALIRSWRTGLPCRRCGCDWPGPQRATTTRRSRSTPWAAPYQSDRPGRRGLAGAGLYRGCLCRADAHPPPDDRTGRRPAGGRVRTGRRRNRLPGGWPEHHDGNPGPPRRLPNWPRGEKPLGSRWPPPLHRIRFDYADRLTARRTWRSARDCRPVDGVPAWLAERRSEVSRRPGACAAHEKSEGMADARRCEGQARPPVREAGMWVTAVRESACLCRREAGFFRNSTSTRLSESVASARTDVRSGRSNSVRCHSAAVQDMKPYRARLRPAGVR